MRDKISSLINGIVESIFPEGITKHPFDYFLHFSVSLLGTFVVYFFLRRVVNLSFSESIIVAVLAILALGLFKEFYVDMYMGRTDMLQDTLANIIGIAVAILVVIKLFRV